MTPSCAHSGVSHDQAHAAIEFARCAGFEVHAGPDAPPAQTLLRAESDLLTAIAYEPSHLSWSRLTIEPNTVFHKRPPQLPVEDELAEIQQCGEQLLAATGYGQYEVSAFSQRGYRCRHNSNYWSFGDYVGIGAGAHGKISFLDGHIERYAKRRQPEEYMAAAPGNFVISTRTVEKGEIVGEFMMNALRQNDGFTCRSLFHERVLIAHNWSHVWNLFVSVSC